MLPINEFLYAMIPLYLMALIGWIARRLNILTAQANQTITQLMLYITLPLLILFSFNKKLTVNFISSFIWLVSMSIFVLTISIIIGSLLRKKSKLPLSQKSVYESLIVFGNQGFIGFAISYILMAEEGVFYLTLFNICYLILIWTYGIYIFTKGNKDINWRVLFLNPGILSTFIGLIILILPLSWPIPLVNTFESIGMMTVPLSMILIGSLLAEIKWHDLQNYCKNIYLWIAAGWKLIMIPLFLFIFLIFNVPYHLIVIAVLTSAMPSATTTSVYAKKYGGDASFASFGVLLSTLLCIITIPLLYSLLIWVYSM